MNIRYLFFVLVIGFTTSCEDVIDVDLAEGGNQLVVDAWLTDESKPQEIRLIKTSPYFDSTPAPAVTGAVVTVTANTGTVYSFEDTNNDGSYIWTPAVGANFGSVGNTYDLEIQVDGRTYTASSMMNRSPVVDSIVYTFEEEELGQPEGYYGEFFARDFVGTGDAYWIKAFKNGLFLNKPLEMILAADASFTAGVDGVNFITPIREAINRIPDIGDDAVDTADFPPYSLGDSIRVEIHSLNLEAFDFLFAARTQMTLGDNSIFAEPPSNIPTNIEEANPPSDDAPPAIGFFNVASMNALGVKVEE